MPEIKWIPVEAPKNKKHCSQLSVGNTVFQVEEGKSEYLYICILNQYGAESIRAFNLNNFCTVNFPQTMIVNVVGKVKAIVIERIGV